MLQISHRELLQVMACCHEGLCAKALVWVPRNIWQGLRWTLDQGEGSIVCNAVIHLTYVQILLCKMFCCRHVELSKELVRNALLKCRMWLHRPRALPQIQSLVHTLVQSARRYSQES